MADWFTMAVTGVKALTSIYDTVKGNESKDRAFSQFLESTTALADEEKEQSIKYGDIAEDMRDPSSYWMQQVKGDWLDAVSLKSEETIKKLRSQGIYSPAMERLITKDFSIQAADQFTSGIADMSKVASQYDTLAQKSFENYADTLASAYTTQFTGTLKSATDTSGGFTDFIGDIASMGDDIDTISDIFGIGS